MQFLKLEKNYPNFFYLLKLAVEGTSYFLEDPSQQGHSVNIKFGKLEKLEK